MPQPQDLEVWSHFSFIRTLGRQYERARCKTCSWEKSANITRCKEHLEKCLGRKAVRNAQNASNSNTQTAIDRFAISLSAQQREKLDNLAAKAILYGGRALTLFEDEAMAEFIYALNPLYKPPSRRVLTESVIPRVFSHLKGQLKADILNTSLYLNIVFDASDDTCLRRQLNISVVVPSGQSIFWRNIDTGSKRHTAGNTMQIVKDEVKIICNGDFSRVNSFVSDTCHTARATTKALCQD